MKLPEMSPWIAFLIGLASSGGTYSILRFGWEGTQKGSILAGLIFGVMTMGCCLLDNDCDCLNCQAEGRHKR